jgi:hypothetical protein
MPTPVKLCPDCGGVGDSCNRCGGQGVVEVTPCPDCYNGFEPGTEYGDGTEKPATRCETCGGSGFVGGT